MKSIVLSLSILFSLPSLCFSQTEQLKWGPKNDKDGGLMSFVSSTGILGDHYYVLNKPNRKATLKKYSLNHKFISEQSLKFKQKGGSLLLNKFIETPKGIFAYTFHKNKNKKTISFHVSTFSKGTFGQPVELLKHKFKPAGYFQKAMSGTSFENPSELVQSPDEKQVVYVGGIEKSSKTSDKFTVAVFNADMTMNWTKEIEMTTLKGHTLDFDQILVTDKGDVFILYTEMKISKALMGNKKSDKFRQFRLLHISEQKHTSHNLKLENGKYMTDTKGYISNTNDIIISGFYSDTDWKSDYKGTYFLKATAKDGVVISTSSAFSDDFLSKFESKKFVRRKKGANYRFTLRDRIWFDDGSVGFVAQEEDIIINSRTDSNGKSTTTYKFVTNDLIIPRYNTQGELINITHIPKNFTYSFAQYTSFAIGFSKESGNTYIAFNDAKDKSERKEITTTTKKGKKGKNKKRHVYTDIVVLDKNGEIVSRETVSNSKHSGFRLAPNLCDFTEDLFLLGGYAGGNASSYGFATFKIK